MGHPGRLTRDGRVRKGEGRESDTRRASGVGSQFRKKSTHSTESVRASCLSIDAGTSISTAPSPFGIRSLGRPAESYPRTSSHSSLPGSTARSLSPAAARLRVTLNVPSVVETAAVKVSPLAASCRRNRSKPRTFSRIVSRFGHAAPAARSIVKPPIPLGESTTTRNPPSPSTSPVARSEAFLGVNRTSDTRTPAPTRTRARRSGSSARIATIKGTAARLRFSKCRRLRVAGISRCRSIPASASPHLFSLINHRLPGDPSAPACNSARVAVPSSFQRPLCITQFVGSVKFPCHL